MPRRRSLLTAGGTVLLSAVAGCNAARSTETATSSPTETPTATPSATETTTATPAVDAARAVVAAMAASEFERAHETLGESLRAQTSPELLNRLWLGMTAQHGAFERIDTAERTTYRGVDAVVVPVVCADDAARWAFPFDDGTLTGVRIDTPNDPPGYADQSAFVEREVTVGEASLPGTVSVPTTDGNTPDGDVPGVVIVHGSGSVDRDGTVGVNRVYRDLAWGLASRGVAVLRYDKRTYVTNVPPADRTLERVTVADAVSAVDRLADVPAVDPARRVVVGHSLGAAATPRLLDRTDAVAGVLLAAHARPITEVVLDQLRHVFSVVGGLSADEEEQIRQVRTAFDRIEAGELPDDRTVVGQSVAWWRSLLAYDQQGAAASVTQPLRIVQGGRDYQVPPTEFERWQSALADRPDTAFRLYESLSHLFQSGTAPSLGEEYSFYDTVARPVVTELAEWVRTV